MCVALLKSLHTQPQQTKGDLRAATDQFVEWLQHQVLQREVARATALGENSRAAGVGKVVLCGHSMGGLVVADALLSIEKTCADGGPLWPRIIAVLAYDTPVSGMATRRFLLTLPPASVSWVASQRLQESSIRGYRLCQHSPSGRDWLDACPWSLWTMGSSAR